MSKRGFHKWWYPNMDGLYWENPMKLHDLGVPQNGTPQLYSTMTSQRSMDQGPLLVQQDQVEGSFTQIFSGLQVLVHKPGSPKKEAASHEKCQQNDWNFHDNPYIYIYIYISLSPYVAW